MASDTLSIEDFDPEDIEIEAINAHHLGGGKFSASFELSDEFDEIARSYLLIVDVTEGISFQIIHQVEDSIRSHISFSEHSHLVLELGGILHQIDQSVETTTLPNGVLTKLWATGPDNVFAIGEEGVSYQRQYGVWEELPNLGDVVLTDVHGTGLANIFMSGSQGHLFKYKDKSWERVELHGDYDFTAIEVYSDGKVWLAGLNGTGFRVDASEMMALETPQRDFFGIRTFKDRQYWSDANFGINIRNGDEIEPIKDTGQAFSLTASEDYLVAVGWREVFYFDGASWRGFEVGYDGGIFVTEVDMANFG